MAARTLDEPLRWPLMVQPGNRLEDTSKDCKLVNCYIDSTPDGQTHIVRRPAFVKYPNWPDPSPIVSSTARGIVNFDDRLFFVAGSTGATAYRGSTSGATALVGVLNTDFSGRYYRFGVTQGATSHLVLGNGIKAYTIAAGGTNNPVQIVDANFPSATDPFSGLAFMNGFAYLDGTIYVMNNSASLLGSNINDASTWNALNVISAQNEPDQPVAVAKHISYILALKTTSIDVFYDAGNPTGSPLSAVPQAHMLYGCMSADSVRDLDGVLFFLGTSAAAGPQFVKMENLQMTVISTPAIERILQGFANSLQLAPLIQAFTFRYDGHKFYLFSSLVANITLVWDDTMGAWYQWMDASGNCLQLVGSAYVPGGLISNQPHNTGTPCFLWPGTSATGNTGCYLTVCDPTTGIDIGATTPFTVEVVTPNFDAGIDRRKHVNVLRVQADKEPVHCPVQIAFSDDDYQTWSNPRTVDLSTSRPFLTNCGTFYRRAMRIRHTVNSRLRLRAVDVQMDVGTL